MHIKPYKTHCLPVTVRHLMTRRLPPSTPPSLQPNICLHLLFFLISLSHLGTLLAASLPFWRRNEKMICLLHLEEVVRRPRAFYHIIPG